MSSEDGVPAKSKYLRRYTHLEALRDVLCTKSVTLLDYAKWEDNNDSYFLQLYKEERKLKSLLALCLTSAPERFHLWQVFGPKSERRLLARPRQPLGCQPYNASSSLTRIGVRIRFNRSALIEAINKHQGRIRWGDIDYLTLAQLGALAKKRTEISPVERLPFIKRYGFRDESEFRIIYESKAGSVATRKIPVPISCINRGHPELQAKP